MSLYPSLEDMEADKAIKAQIKAVQELNSTPAYSLYPNGNGASTSTGAAGNNAVQPFDPKLYPSLQTYMGMELSAELIALNMPEYSVVPSNQSAPALPSMPSYMVGNMVAPISGNSVGLARAQVTHGIREAVVCKDAKGKIGLCCESISKGIFIGLVQAGSPAALAGLRFGDQILQINSENVAGYSADKVHSILKKAGVNNIRLVIRDRPFERTITLHKDSVGHIGFCLKDGKIVSLVKDSSAARNGVLTDHNLLEVNGQNVVGMKTKEISRILDGAGSSVTITIMPAFLYDHMIKHMSSSLIKKAMDRSLPEV